MKFDRILRFPEIVARLGIKRRTIYDMIERGDFPAPIKLTPKVVGWRPEQIESWLESRPFARIQPHGPAARKLSVK